MNFASDNTAGVAPAIIAALAAANALACAVLTPSEVAALAAVPGGTALSARMVTSWSTTTAEIDAFLAHLT